MDKVERDQSLAAPPRWSTSSRDEVSDYSDIATRPDLPSLLPLSHEHPLLTASESWDVDEFLLTRLHIPLEELRGELREYLGNLKEELGGLINDDYEEFISLGLGLRGEGGRLEGLRYPLEALKVEVKDINTHLQSSQTELQTRLDERSSLRSERAILDTLLHLSESLTRTEALLDVAGPSSSTSKPIEVESFEDDEPSAVRSRSKVVPKLAVIIDTELEQDGVKDLKTVVRIANEYTQVMYLVEKARVEECEYVTSEEGGVEQRVDHIRQALYSNLGRILSSILKDDLSERSMNSSQRRDELRSCLEVYDNIEAWQEAEKVVRDIVEKKIEGIVEARALTTAPSPAIPNTPFGLKEINPMSPALATPHTPMTMSSLVPGSNIFESTLSATKSSFTENSELREAQLLDESTGSIALIFNNILMYIDRELLDLLHIGEEIRQKRKLKSLRSKSDHLEPSANGDEPILEEISISDSEASFEFMANAIWVPIGERIMEELGGVLFAAGRVTELHQNYTLAHQLIAQLESLSSSIPAVVAMRSTETYRSFEKRWQLPVYFQLRWKEIIRELEDGLQLDTNGIASEKGRDGFALSSTAAVITAYKACWAEDVYIPELGYRFWRLSLQIISRYRTLIESSVPALYETLQHPSTRDSISLPGNSNSQVGPALPTGDPSSDAASAQAEEQILKVASLITYDLSKAHKDISGFWNDTVRRVLLQTMGEEEIMRLETALNHSLSSLSALYQSPSLHIISILSRRCIVPLKGVRLVGSHLRAVPVTQEKEVPKPSGFIPEVLKPLNDYFGPKGYGQGLKDEVGPAWSRKVMEEIIAAYIPMLIGVQKFEDNLRRNQKGKKSTFSLFGSSNNASNTTIEQEEERFKQQMIVNVRSLGQGARDLGVQVEQGDLAGWTALLETAERNATA